MVRVPLTPDERERGERLGRALREARGERSIADVATAAEISAETLRKIETGRIPTPALFTVAALATALALSLDELVAATEPETEQATEQATERATDRVRRAARPSPAA
ncbi:MAG: helix-turn-helix domain-containing protein [Actinomycetota bacterium]|nr:helix-turn-helix domain-containing protein [Actinomycetota bacterium]